MKLYLWGLLLVEHLLKVSLIGLVSGIAGTSIGGCAAFLITRITNRMLGFILEFSAGLMTAVVCFELLPEAFELGGTANTLIGVLAGVGIIMLIENSMKKAQFAGGGKNRSLLQAGILMATAIALHNFPEGFAVGSSFEASSTIGFTITAVIIIHDIPEGIAIAVPLRSGGFSKLKSFVYTVLSGLPMCLGAFLGAAIGGISQDFISICLGFAGGAMLYIVCAELVPESKRLYLGRLSSIGNVIGLICGIIVSVYN